MTVGRVYRTRTNTLVDEVVPLSEAKSVDPTLRYCQRLREGHSRGCPLPRRGRHGERLSADPGPAPADISTADPGPTSTTRDAAAYLTTGPGDAPTDATAHAPAETA
jgi:hypothetical protein